MTCDQCRSWLTNDEPPTHAMLAAVVAHTMYCHTCYVLSMRQAAIDSIGLTPEELVEHERFVDRAFEDPEVQTVIKHAKKPN